MVGGSCKRQDILGKMQVDEIFKALENDEIISGQGLNKERTLARPSDTHWGSHYGTLMSLIHLYVPAIKVIDFVMKKGNNSQQRALAMKLLKEIQIFEFVFHLHLMKRVLGITNDLSQALQRKDQDIVNAISLVRISRKRLQALQDEGWASLMKKVSQFCAKHDISVPNMDDFYVKKKRPNRLAEKIINSHHYRIELFYMVIDMQLQELNNRFNEVNSELLLCVACLNPSNGFAAFDKQKLTRLARLYPHDFSKIELLALSDQLENFVMDMRLNIAELELKGISDVTQKND